MLSKPLAATLYALLLALPAGAAQLPELRIEPTGGGSILYIRNASPQPLTAYLIELVNYPGSEYSLWQDYAAATPIPPGGEKKIQITNMTVGAVPDYVKMQAALYADGTSSGIPEKVAQLTGRRRFTLETTRELIGRLEKAVSAGTPKATVIASLREWTDGMPPPTRANRNGPAAINQAAAKGLIADTAKQLDAHPLEETLTALRAAERALAASKPDL
jgi:hypothetical protein